jgi:cell division septal protein FtsQ
MMDQKKQSEQMSLQDYWAITEEDDSPHNFSSYNKDQSSRRGNQVRKDAVSPHSLRRVVTNPNADASQAWTTFAQRKQEPSREHAQSPQRVPMLVPAVQRTLAQTAVPATRGRARTSKHSLPNSRLLPKKHSLPNNRSFVSKRSGQRNGRSSLLRKVLGICAFGSVAIVTVIFALTSKTFRINQVNVVSTHNNALIQQIQHMNMQGQNIFLLDVAGLTQRIDALPQVSSSELSKQWPNEVSIRVEERVPVLLWQMPQGTYSIDKQGVVIAPVSETTSVNTVIDLTAQTIQHMQTGQPVQMTQTLTLHPGMRLNEENVAYALDVLNLLPQMAGVSTFKLYYDGTMYTGGIRQWGGGADSGGSYIVASPDGWKAYLGGPNDTNPLSNKLIELRAILALAQRQQLNVATIDLRYGTHPVFTLK